MPNSIDETTVADGGSARRVARWITWGGPLVLAVALLLHAIVFIHWPTYALQIDVLVYRFGGTRVLDGLDLYSIGRNGEIDDLLFTYTPFAALVFTPLAFITDFTAQVLSLLVFPALLVYSVWRMLRWLNVSVGAGLWGLLALLVGLVSWLEPVRLSIQLGQINLLILAVVVTDVLAPKRWKLAGIGIGIVAGIKLTPMIFIVFLFVVGRIRAAVVATVTLIGTIALGFIFLPSASHYYWVDRAFEKISRITRDPTASTSISGLFLRLDLSAATATALSVLVIVVSLVIATMAYRRNQLLLAISVVGMASAAASPFSWSHHWVWFVPLVVHLSYRGYVLGKRASAITMWVFCAVFAAWFTSLSGKTPDSGALTLRPGGVLNDLIPSLYVFVHLGVLVASWIWLRRDWSEANDVAGEEESSQADELAPASPAHN
ncbi:membrane protein [Mycobacteroides saopaulense]|uniref:glycosyltransferase 87 family protein n=1 Tax=Mycobacteroides saopaulense TaxID=1578165 RepID=UPI000721F1A3|nr:glycosyltransferase 87 family protein [Mycobacteroides saopaulense]ALR11526.1 membrane protein [Mycobacteroides saopaulense]